jgi:hypothetical protein
MNIVRKYISFLLISVLLYNIGGYCLLFNALKYSIQRENEQQILKGLRDDELTLISVPLNGSNGISWIKPGKEFMFKGQMFDVVKTATKQHEKIYYCLRDAKEKQLISRYLKTHKTKSESEKKLKSGVALQFCIPQMIRIQGAYPTALSYRLNYFPLLTSVSEIPSPPPRLA